MNKDDHKKNDVLGTPGVEQTLEDDLPSVNAAKKGNKFIGKLALIFVGILGLYLIYQFNAGPSRKERAERKKEKVEAEANAIGGALPAIGKPPAPPEASMPASSDASALSAGQSMPATNGRVPAIDANGKPVAPVEVRSTRGGNGGSSNSGGSGKAAQSPLDAALERKAVAPLEVKVAGVTASGSSDITSSSGQQSEIARRMAAYGLTPDGKPLNSGASGSGIGGSGGGNDELSKSLQPTVTKGTKAGILPNRDFLIAKGAFLDCALDTRIDSTVPGMTSCTLTRPVYSDNSKVLLLEAGSQLTGQYQGGLKQGQARIFVLWTRVKTPKGVVVNLDSPGTDALGASGLDGYVDTHFWERFGGAIMMSLIGDASDYMVAKQQQNGATYLGNTQNTTENMATEALKSSINIPPTLRKNQGDHINIFLARDLDFGDVYAIRAR